jgi:hypothetical protein
MENHMTEALREQAQKLAQDLENAGQAEHAAKVRDVLAADHPESGFLWALRNVCDTLLTMLEAIDPVSEIALEDLRVRLDAKLSPPPTEQK